MIWSYFELQRAVFPPFVSCEMTRLLYYHQGPESECKDLCSLKMYLL